SHREVLRDSIRAVTKPAVRRLTQCTSDLLCEVTRAVQKVFSIRAVTKPVVRRLTQRSSDLLCENVIRAYGTSTEHAKCKTVMAMGVICVLKRQGRMHPSRLQRPNSRSLLFLPQPQKRLFSGLTRSYEGLL
ncbi:LOW QUALITY PROTEIN: hypothetical protein MC885_020483, partial [Smutsia gigantea]